MLSKTSIQKAIPQVLKTVDLPQLGKKLQGKVRDNYIDGDRRILITTDRQSAFDVNLGFIPYKGTALNQLAAFWFEQTKSIIPNHVIALPDPNVTVVHNCQPLPVEMVIRGYLTGVTKTSIWYSYEKGERMIYGLPFPDGMQKNQPLAQPIITPTTKPELGSGKHDERLTREEIISKKIVEPSIYKQMEKASLALFKFGSDWCQKKGLILVDTKYEFGLCEGKLMLIDEVHTPDSSRFWKADTYQEKFKNGAEPENFDKEFLRLRYAQMGYLGDGQPPVMPEDLVVELAQRYAKVYEMISGQTLKAYEYPIEERILASLKNYLV